MKNNGYTNWKQLTVFLCLASFTPSASCTDPIYLPTIQSAITKAYAIQNLKDARKVLEVLTDDMSSVQEELGAIVTLTSSFDPSFWPFRLDGIFVMEFMGELDKQPRKLTVLQQAYLLSAAMLNKRYKTYRKNIAALETKDKINVLMYMAASAQANIVARLIPIYNSIGELDARSNEGFSALSVAIDAALKTQSASSYSRYKQIISNLLDKGASRSGIISYQDRTSIKSSLLSLGFVPRVVPVAPVVVAAAAAA